MRTAGQSAFFMGLRLGDKTGRHFCLGSRVDGALARALFGAANLAGAVTCPAYLRGTNDRWP